MWLVLSHPQWNGPCIPLAQTQKSDAFVQMHFTSGVDMAKAKCHIISSSKDLPFSSLFFCVKLKSNKTMLCLFMNLCYSNIVFCFGRSGDSVLNLIFPYFPMRSSPGLPSNRLQPETHLLEVAIKVLASQCGLHRTTMAKSRRDIRWEGK